VLRINHYWTKSTEEFTAKRSRGRADQDYPGIVRKMIRQINQDIAMAKDVVANDTAIDWAIPFIKANLVKRHIS
jgi:hypothetical protein